MYEGYEDDIGRVIESEVYGEATFGAAARWSPLADRRRSWALLCRLEQQTRQQISAFARRAELRVPAFRRYAVAGTVGGTTMGLVPWSVQMRLVLDATDRYMPIFERLASAHRDGPDAALFAYIVDHEVALAEFARLEMRRSPRSLDLVTDLLPRHGDATPA